MELIALTLGALGGALAARGLSELREHRTTPAGLADLLNWGFMVDDGVVLQKDGSLLAGYGYRGPDLNASTAEELDALSRHLNDALQSDYASLNPGQIAQVSVGSMLLGRTLDLRVDT